MSDAAVNIENEAPASEPAPQAPKGPKVFRMKPKPKPKVKSVREQSAIAFPYMDLDAGIAVARAIHGAGGVALTRDQLAGVMNLAAGSGNFVLRVAAARLFGLIATVQNK